MNKFDIDLREKWEQLPTTDLEEMLCAELEKQPPDDDIVLLLLHILEAREPDDPLVLTAGEQAAFERYKQSRSCYSRKRIAVPRWLSVAACGVLILGFLSAVVPQKAEAETFWEMLQRMSTAVIEYFSGEGQLIERSYAFDTDNAGLQQVYDAVVALGVTEPMVPMWLPDGFELREKNTIETPMLKSVYALFSNGENGIVFALDMYDGEPAHQYYRDDTHYESYEKNGTIFKITRNIDNWVVVWANKNVECTITVDCREGTLRRILESIYVMEE